MLPNPALAALGFAPEDRVVIMHADDLGMCHAANTAFAALVESGRPLSGSVMVPCPWFPELAALGRAHPEADIGVHLTLNSEHPLYRWGPVSTRDVTSGLLDPDGYSPSTVEALHSRMSADAAMTEMRTQIERALAAGLDVTHLDAHMAAVVYPSLLRHYVDLALQFR
ncbi:MAG TPA: ChbG/HpnK family deacetylase, partial [Anaerolineae bacterium]|nr:ChbG/HpnK family deacetylase [Anaerolineae bacterium]